ncbi:hypothetical protein E2C01_094484 [Portunus trituberculatus]|uniref:Uncharacterized protein n=1 Tax=Portunus trituberculatus TaxID=210409 RepID=A0A5B7K1S4_PORTR|nr:hypothetical protein [Portunus trituberculatus]
MPAPTNFSPPHIHYLSYYLQEANQASSRSSGRQTQPPRGTYLNERKGSKHGQTTGKNTEE